MFWIGIAAIAIVFYSSRTYVNNHRRWQKHSFPFQASKLIFFLLQSLNLLFAIAGILFLMLAIVSHVKGYQIIFSSDYSYHLKLISP
jgi:hypothetical protein